MKESNEQHQEQSSSSSSAASSISRCPYAAAIGAVSAVSGGTTNHDNGTNDRRHLDSSSKDDDDDGVTNHHITASSSSSSSTSPILSFHEHPLLAMEALKSCPAFQNGSCPFKGTKDPASMRQALLQIPPSHYNNNGNNSNSNNDGNINSGSSSTTTTTTSSATSGSSSPASTVHPKQKQQNQHAFVQFIQQFHDAVGSSSQGINSNSNSTNTTASSSFPKRMSGCPVMANAGGVKQELEEALQQRAVTFTEALEHCSLATIMAKMASSASLGDEEEEDDDEPYNKNDDEKKEEEEDDHSMLTQKENSKSIAQSVDDGIGNKSNAGTSSSSSSSSVPVVSANNQLLLSESFKMGTINAHREAEDVHFVKNFIRGDIDREVYKVLLIQLYHVYDTLEEFLLNNNDNSDSIDRSTMDNVKNGSSTTIDRYCLQQFIPYHTKLQRKQSLLDDLDYWLGDTETTKIIQASISSGNNIIISPACCDYIKRLQYIQEHEPILLLAHSYTRYLGDLSGGKILARVARRALNLHKNDGLAFYDFTTTIKSAKIFKDEYKRALDELPLSTEQVTALVQEANIAFILNMRLFEELDVLAGVPGAKVRPLADAYAQYSNNDPSNAQHYSKTNFSNLRKEQQQQQSSSEVQNIPPECPFAKLASASGSSSSSKVLSFLHPPVKHPKTTIENSSSATAVIDNNDSSNGNYAIEKEKKKVLGGRCPWPFIFGHDPIQGLYDWQTWAVLGCILSYWWYKKMQ